MQFEQVFTSAIEVGIAIAGFSGIVAVLGQRARGEWSRGDLGRMVVLLQSSFAAILLSFLVLILEGAQLREPLIWGVGSGCTLLYLVVVIPLRVRDFRKVQAADKSYSPVVFWVAFWLMVVSAAFQAYNLAVLQAGWPFALGVVTELALALIVFVRLLQALWRQSAA